MRLLEALAFSLLLVAGCELDEIGTGPDAMSGKSDDLEICPAEDRCDVDVEDFCASVRCARGTHCDEADDRCVADLEDFCASVRCARGTHCDEADDRCVADDPLAPAF